MELGIKLSLSESKDYDRLSNFLSEPKDVSLYTDYFFDFDDWRLHRHASFLRLRVFFDHSLCVRDDGDSVFHASALEGETISDIKPATYCSTTLCNSLSCIHEVHAFSLQDRRSSNNYLTFFGSPMCTSECNICKSRFLSADLTFKSGNAVGFGEQMSFVIKAEKVNFGLVKDFLSDDRDILDILSQITVQGDSVSPIGNSSCGLALRSIFHRLLCINNNSLGNRTCDFSSCESSYTSRECSEVVKMLPPKSYVRCVGKYSTLRKKYWLLLKNINARGSSTHLPRIGEVGDDIYLSIRVDKSSFGSHDYFELETEPSNNQNFDLMDRLKTFLIDLHINFTPSSEHKFARYVRESRRRTAKLLLVRDVKLQLTSESGYRELLCNLKSTCPLFLSGMCETGRKDTIPPACSPDSTYDNHCLSTTTSETDNDNPYSVSKNYTYSEEDHENYFFDGPNDELSNENTFLRLRRYVNTNIFELALKVKQDISCGIQNYDICKTQLCDSTAALLLGKYPSVFLQSQHDLDAVAKILWDSKRLRSLRATVCFSTHRVTSPWLVPFAPCQHDVKSFQAKSAGMSCDQSHECCQSATNVLFSREQQCFNLASSSRCHTELHNSDRCPSHSIFTVHIDRTEYNFRQSFCHSMSSEYDFVEALSHSCSEAQLLAVDDQYSALQSAKNKYVAYEVEVTHIDEADASQVKNNLCAALDALNIEWQPSTESKLDHYYTILKSQGKSCY